MGGSWSGFEDGLADFLSGGSAFGQYAGQAQGQGGTDTDDPKHNNPTLKDPNIPFVQKTTNYSAPPQQQAINNNFSSTTQSQARFGPSPSHF